MILQSLCFKKCLNSNKKYKYNIIIIYGLNKIKNVFWWFLNFWKKGKHVLVALGL